MRTSLLLVFGLLVMRVCAQESTPPWRILNDSVYQVLGLSEDQVQRVRVIDDQYAEERAKLNSSPETVTRPEMERRLSGLIADREKEVRGVMTREQFEGWVGKRPQPPAKPRQKARTK